MMTLLKAWKRLTKLHQHDGHHWNTSGYGRAEWFRMRTVHVDSLPRLVTVLRKIEQRPDICVIRGIPAEDVDLDHCQRHYKKEPITVLAHAPQWLMIDIDDLDEPAGSDMLSDVQGCVEFAIGALPDEFQDATCFWQASGSAGLKPGIKLHLWYWLNRPVSDAEAKGWLKTAPVDRAIYNPIQIHYTARPLFISGSYDPMRVRSGMRTGLSDVVDVPDVLEAIEADIDAKPVEFTDAAPDIESLRRAVTKSIVVRNIWTGVRTYTDRSKAHFALGCALARAGVRDPDTILAALRAYDEMKGNDLTKIDRPDYAELTIGTCLAKTA